MASRVPSARFFQRGVYFTVDEFKGRRPVVRGSTTLTVEPSRLRNPLSVPHLPAQSGGSRGRPMPVPLNFAHLRNRAVNFCLVLYARKGMQWDHAIWGVPGSTPIGNVLVFAGCGVVPVRWFSQVDSRTPGLHPRYRWSTRAMRWGSLLARVPLARRENASLTDPLPVARWMEEVLRNGRTPHLMTFASSAVRLSEAAGTAGVDFSGAQFTIAGEPVTAARLAAIRAVGAEGFPFYGSSEPSATATDVWRPKWPIDLRAPHHTVGDG